MQNYDNILNSVVKYASEEFKYGKMDCAIFSGKILKDITDIDVLNKFENQYSNTIEAEQWFKNNNYNDLIEAVSDILNKPITSVDNLQDGDIVIKEAQKSAFNYALGIVYKNYGFFIRENKHSMARIPLSKCKGGWAING